MPFYFLARQIDIVFYPGATTGWSTGAVSESLNNISLEIFCLGSFQVRTCAWWICYKLKDKKPLTPQHLPCFCHFDCDCNIDKSRHLFSKVTFLSLMTAADELPQMWDVRDIEFYPAVSSSQLDWLQLYSSPCSMSSSSSSTSGN